MLHKILLCIPFVIPAAAAGDRPNIVFVYADDHAERAVGAYGSPLTKTPHIDALAAEGVRFRNSFVANSICGPARATVLTGLHSHANGKKHNGGGFKDELPTWAKLLQSSGYQTAMIGKWHIGPKPSGFDHWAIAKGGYYGPTMVTAEGKTKTAGYTTEVITQASLDWIKSSLESDEPFAIWINHAASHRTWMPGPQYHDRYAEQVLPEPSTLFDDYAGRSPGAAASQMRIARDLFGAYDLKLPAEEGEVLGKRGNDLLNSMTETQRSAWEAAYGPRNAAFAKAGLEGDALVRWKYQRYIRDYLRCVDALDDSLGQVRSFLKDNGLADNTIVIYSSDQGFFLGEHGWYDKRWLYEPSMRTPLSIHDPRSKSQGIVVDQLVQNIDMAPTILEYAGLEVPSSMHGASLASLAEEKQGPDWRTSIYYHYQQRDSGRTSHTVAPHYGVRTKQHKLIHVYDFDAWELYDLEGDPDEMHNLFGTEGAGEITSTLVRELQRLREKFQDGTGKAI